MKSMVKVGTINAVPRVWLRVFAITLVVILVFSSIYVPAQAAPSAAPTGQRLRTLAGSFLIGYEAMTNFTSISDSAQFQEVARTEFNIVTPENAMKWDATEPSQNNFSFGGADQLVNFAKANNQKIHGHTLVWHAQLPGWVNSACTNATTCTNIMYNHIDKVMNHYADGEINVWDVVNEAFNENGTRRSSVFQNVIGNSFIELAFRRARAADPLTKLIYNDYNVETVNSKSTAMYNMVADFKNRGVPIDGVGLQMHMTGAFDYNSLAQNMQRFAALGVEVYITEMDVRYPTPISQANLTAQGEVYRNVTQRCRAQPACKALQTWGITDRHSWVPGTFPGTGDALMFDANYNPKPAYYAVQAVLGSNPGPTNTPTRSVTRTNTPVPSGDGTPYGGTAAAVPGTIQAENYNVGGEGVAYHDNEAANQGGQYRTGEGVDVETVTDTGGGYDVGYTVAGEWMKYTVNVQTSGSYTLTFRVASQQTGGSFHLEVDGVNVTGAIAMPNTGGWQTYTNVTRTGINLTAGQRVLRLVVDGSNGNFNWFSLSSGTAPTNTPVGPTPTRSNTPSIPTNTPIAPTATPSGNTCSPVTATVTAPFTHDGAGTFCWRISSFGNYINSWNTTSVTVNGVNFTNLWASPGQMPAKANDGYWYIRYQSSVAWGHFEVR